MVARDLAIFVGTGVSILAALKLSGAADVEVDPRSANFGKVRVGNTRLDFWCGYTPIARLAAQLMTEARLAESSSWMALIRAGGLSDFRR